MPGSLGQTQIGPHEQPGRRDDQSDAECPLDEHIDPGTPA
jgi:hypothetical protein